MGVLIVGVLLGVGLLILPSLLGKHRRNMLAQYEILEKRFHFEKKIFHSKWGRGIGDRYSLSGVFRGYSISLYDHFHTNDMGKSIWTSLAFEMPSLGEMEIVLNATEGDASAQFPLTETLFEFEAVGRFRCYATSESIGGRLFDESTRDRLTRFTGPGSFRLSKGFFEYRESGLIEDDATRVRYQGALVLLAELGDHLMEGA